MLGLLRRKPEPAAEIGPDGMTDYAREMHLQWKRRDEVTAKINAAVAERLGIHASLLDFMNPETVVLGVLLGIKVGD